MVIQSNLKNVIGSFPYSSLLDRLIEADTQILWGVYFVKRTNVNELRID